MLAHMNGDEIRRLREARKMTQSELATAIGVGVRTVTNWETGATVPKNRLGMLRSFFGLDDAEAADPLRAASDLTLLSELVRRAVERQSATG